MKEKYINERVGVWFQFGDYADGCVDVNDGTRDVFLHVSEEIADALIDAQNKFRGEISLIINGAKTKC